MHQLLARVGEVLWSGGPATHRSKNDRQTKFVELLSHVVWNNNELGSGGLWNIRMSQLLAPTASGMPELLATPASGMRGMPLWKIGDD